MTKDRFKWEQKWKAKIETKLELSTSSVLVCVVLNTAYTNQQENIEK